MIRFSNRAQLVVGAAIRSRSLMGQSRSSLAGKFAPKLVPSIERASERASQLASQPDS